jgi:hypothetical protein
MNHSAENPVGGTGKPGSEREQTMYYEKPCLTHLGVWHHLTTQPIGSFGILSGPDAFTSGKERA